MFAAFGFEGGCGPSAWQSRGGPGPDFGGWGGWSWAGPGARRGGPGRRAGRMFEQGDLKLVILRLLDEKPRHGYEIIKALEERTGGAYAPSPGAVYPTLTLLEELGYARSTDEGNGRRIYEITAEGREYLAQHRTVADDVFARLNELGDHLGARIGELAGAVGTLGRAAYGAAARAGSDRERLRQVREVLERAARELDGLP